MDDRSPLTNADELAERFRQQKYRLLTNDCIIKSFKFKKACKVAGIEARVVICLGLGRAMLFGRWLMIPVIHSWGEVEGKRIETSRPIGAWGVWGIVPVKIKPVIAIWV